MLTFISCAKTMTARTKTAVPFTTDPLFPEEVQRQVFRMAALDTAEMGRLLHVNPKLAAQNCLRYHDFYSETNRPLPALLSYTGMVFKRIAPQDFTADDFAFAQEHLRITSFLYGLVRPLDLIRNYRLEGSVPTEEGGRETIFEHWRPLLTECFIRQIQEQGGILVNLASAEMKDLFHWKEVESSVRVITPEFYTLKNGKPTTVVVYAKMCRGEMTRFIIRNRIEDPEQLKTFTWEGFTYHPELSEGDRLVFCMQA